MLNTVSESNIVLMATLTRPAQVYLFLHLICIGIVVYNIVNISFQRVKYISSTDKITSLYYMCGEQHRENTAKL